MVLNELRFAGDFLHGSAILLLIVNIIKTRSCHSVSGIMAILYTIVFTCRYLDFVPFDNYSSIILSLYNSTFKIYFLCSSYLLILLIYVFFRNTRDRIHHTFPIYGHLVCAQILTWSVCYFTDHREVDKEFFWRFSIFLEMLAIIPQMSSISQQGTIDQATTYYMIMLGSSRGLYILNWIYRYRMEQFWEPLAFFGGVIQTIIYLHFFVHIYPCLTHKRADHSAEVNKIPISIVGTKEMINKKAGEDTVLIHNV